MNDASSNLYIVKSIDKFQEFGPALLSRLNHLYSELDSLVIFSFILKNFHKPWFKFDSMFGVIYPNVDVILSNFGDNLLNKLLRIKFDFASIIATIPEKSGPIMALCISLYFDPDKDSLSSSLEPVFDEFFDPFVPLKEYPTPYLSFVPSALGLSVTDNIIHFC